MFRTTITLAVAVAAAVGAPALARTPSQQPSFRSYAAPAEFDSSGGEPSIGVNPRSGAVLYQTAWQTLRVDGFDRAGAGTSSWHDVTPQDVVPGSFDSVLKTDPGTGRTWTARLQLACSRIAYTDNDGRSWTQVPVGCSPGALTDHETLGAGPFPPGTLGVTHPAAVYYCANSILVTSCGVSRDGGSTFAPARPVTGTETVHACSIAFGMHVARDGTAYLTPYTCSGKAGVVVTEDAGLTWHDRVVPGSSTGDTTLEGGAATDAAGKLYLVWGSRSGAGGPANVAVSPDKGKTWLRPYELGQAFGLRNTQFTNAVAGDAGRAAVSFLGARESGDDQSDSYRGIWRLYVAFTYDGGRTWRTTEATPDSPVQVGAICLGGITCGESRNLLDFNDLAMDSRGQVLAAVTDGCLQSRCSTSSRATVPMIVQQASGRGLLARYDR